MESCQGSRLPKWRGINKGTKTAGELSLRRPKNHPTSLTSPFPLNLAKMRLTALVSLVAASVAIASPAAHLKKRATCPGGQAVDDAQCCIWFDVLDDLQTKLYVFSLCKASRAPADRIPPGSMTKSAVSLYDVSIPFRSSRSMSTLCTRERRSPCPSSFIPRRNWLFACFDCQRPVRVRIRQQRPIHSNIRHL